jgi:hypothetical protein
MSDSVEDLILDLLEWVARHEHTYQETFDAWRTSCPRLPVWEDATERGLIASEASGGRTLMRPTVAGLRLLKERRPRAHAELHDGGALTRS